MMESISSLIASFQKETSWDFIALSNVLGSSSTLKQWECWSETLSLVPSIKTTEPLMSSVPLEISRHDLGTEENLFSSKIASLDSIIELIETNSLDDIKPCIVNPKIDDDVEFEINANFIRILRRKLFASTDDDDAYEHVRRVLEIVDLFHFPGVTHDAIMLRERINDVLDNIDAIYKSFKGEHLTKEYPLKKEDETADDERMRKILENTETNLKALKTRTNNLQEKAYQLTHKVLTNTGEKVKAIKTMGKENMKEPVPRDLPPIPFLGHLKEQMGSPYRTRETVRMVRNPKEIHNTKAKDDEADIDVGKDVERLRKILTPTIHTLPNLEPVVQPYIPLGPVYDEEKIVRDKEQDYDIPLNDNIMQPLTPQIIHITPPDDDYVAPVTSPIFNKQLNKFEEGFSNITRVVDTENDNPVKDVRNLLDIKTYDCETFIRKLLHQGIKSLRENEDNLKISAKFHDLKQCSRSFLS
ncbi:hypothetical protein Tco_0965376 [Tanacetum coccineum]